MVEKGETMNLSGTDMQIQELRDRLAACRAELAAAVQRAEAAEKDANELRADNEMNAHYATRALHAEAALAAVDGYGQYMRAAGREEDDDLMVFAQWLARRAEVAEEWAKAPAIEFGPEDLPD